MTTTVLLADDHTLVRDGLALLIGQHVDWEVVASCRFTNSSLSNCSRGLQCWTSRCRA